MKKRFIILYWLLLLLPTVVISVFSFRLLSHERNRIDQEALSSAYDRAWSIGEALRITVAAVEEELTKALHAINPGVLSDTLIEWEKKNPLIRNVFIWRHGSGLEYPIPDSSLTAEESRFIARYDALFSGRFPWQPAGNENTENAGPSPQLTSGKKDFPEVAQETPKYRTGMKQLIDLAKGEGEALKTGTLESEDYSEGRDGWIPWFSENRLYILGWVRQDQIGPVYGIELELMTLISRLVADFPGTVPKGMVYALLNGSGDILHQIGDRVPETGSRPDLSISLSPYLPHWQIAVYSGGYLSDVGAGRSFYILSGLLLVIFIIAILLGGSLLSWQAHRNMTDARQKTTFVSNVSHELKTPLTSIRMYAELLSEERVKGEEKRKQYLQVIVDESQRLTRLVNNVLDFSRLEQGRKKYHLQELDLKEILTGCLESQRLRINEAGLELSYDIPDINIKIIADRDAIEQVMLNLIDNAIKYASDGGELAADLQIANGECRIKMMDKGPGVPPAHRARIFDKFHRVDDTLTAAQPGSGLGLSIARRLLRDMNGDIFYEPREGGGSCFVVLLPCRNLEIARESE